jgi:hypothetical protein
MRAEAIAGPVLSRSLNGFGNMAQRLQHVTAVAQPRRRAVFEHEVAIGDAAEGPQALEINDLHSRLGHTLFHAPVMMSPQPLRQPVDPRVPMANVDGTDDA